MASPDRQERNARMVAMYRQGLTLDNIGQHFGITRERVRQILRARGVDRGMGGMAAQQQAKLQAKQTAKDAKALAIWGVDHATMKKHRADKLLSAYVSQRNSARIRGIEWGLNFAQWIKVWRESDKLAQRGRGKGKYVMSRIRDEGGYVVGNVHIQLSTENNSQGLAKARNNRAENTGVWCIYPKSSRPWVAKVAKVHLGTFATEKEAVEARAAYLRANPTVKTRKGRGYTVVRRGTYTGYQTYAPGIGYVGTYRTPEAALAARAVAMAGEQPLKAA